jgi:hypothetical protein
MTSALLRIRGLTDCVMLALCRDKTEVRLFHAREGSEFRATHAGSIGWKLLVLRLTYMCELVAGLLARV